MRYVIFDLEWDSVFYKPEKRFVNQILQIGAVKLDGNMDITDRFSVTVRSAVSEKVTKRFSELTGITSEQIRDGVPYSVAVGRFNDFVSDADITATWSDSDIFTIIENERFLKDTGISYDLKHYFDLQKLVQNAMRKNGYDSNNQVSLKAAAEFFGIDTSEFEMHTAMDDSTVCAGLFKICRNDDLMNSLLRDTGEVNFRERFLFKSYQINNIKDKKIDKTKLVFSCPNCGKTLQRLSKWKYKNRWFSATHVCKECDKTYSGKVFVKMMYDGPVYKRRLKEIVLEDNKNEVQSVSETV